MPDSAPSASMSAPLRSPESRRSRRPRHAQLREQLQQGPATELISEVAAASPRAATPRASTIDADQAAELATEALRLVTVAPERARDLAAEVQRAARRSRDWESASRAARAAGLASLQLRDLAAAVVSLRWAIAAARRAGSERLEAEARMSLAATLMVGGSPRRAIAEVEAALRGLDGLAAARARVQRATIFQAVGRFDEALVEFRAAIPVLRRENDVEWHSRALNNRSVLFTTRRAFAAAEADLVAAEALCAGNGLELPAAYAKQNLGCLKAGQGEVVAALDLFDAAGSDYQRLGVQVGSLLVDRGELLLSVRLVAEARDAAREAVSVLRQQQRRAEVPAAQLLLSTAELLAGNASGALLAAEQSAREFARLGRHSGQALARYAQLQAQLETAPSLVSAGRVRRLAVELAQAGWAVPSLEARVLAGRLALVRGRTADAKRDLTEASRARRSGPADVRARAWLAEALLRAADGRRQSAGRALAAGLRIVEDYQATLGATELRAHVSVHRGALARLGVRMAIEDRSARQALTWAERSRVSGLLIRPPRPPNDGVLASALADLRTTMKEIEDRLGAGRGTGDLVQRQVRLERQVADRQRRLPPTDRSATMRPASLADIGAELGGRALVEYIDLDGTLHAVTVVDGVARLTTLGPVEVIRDRIAHLTFALQRLAQTRTARSTASTLSVLQTIGEGFDLTLLSPLAGLIGDRPLVLIPTGVLQSLPWSVLPSCSGRPITVAPSATAWSVAARRLPPAAPGTVVVVAGPGLPGARAEAETVAALYSGATLLVDDHATVNALSVASGAALVHVAAHGQLRSDNPLFSSLLMADGPLTVYDLDRLAVAPHHVILAACNSARMHALAGDEVLGFAAALLVQGTRSLVAPVLPVPDSATVSMMDRYHRRLLLGDTPSVALAAAQQAAASDGPAARATAAAFVCLGAG